MKNITYKGSIITFNGNFGFIKSELGEIYFHKSGIDDNSKIEKGDEVEFEVEPSPKKEGSFQCFNITIIKKDEKQLVNLLKSVVVGILKWYDEEKGYGKIGTPEDIDYFLHKSNLLNENIKLIKGDVLVFEEKNIKGKKSAINCKKVNEYEDLIHAFYYLSRKDSVNVEFKVEESGYRGKTHYYIHNKNYNIPAQTVFQIFKNREIEDILKFVSDYFKEKLYDKSLEEQLFYFNFVKNTFEQINKKLSFGILTSFFSQYSKFLINHKELSYTLWFEGYIKEKELSNIAKQMFRESNISYNNSILKIFTKIAEPNEQEIVLKDFLELIEKIDSTEKYIKIKYLAELSEIDKNVKDSFLISVLNHSDSERKFLMWLEGYTQEKDLSYIANQIITEPTNSLNITFKKIFNRLNDPYEQETVLKEFIEIVGSFDSEDKYSWVFKLGSLSEIDNKTKGLFLTLVYNRSNIENQYLMWLDNLYLEKNLSYIAKKILNETISLYSKTELFEKIFTKIAEPNEQEIVLKDFLELIEKIDSTEKYIKIKYLAELSEIDKNVKDSFLISVLNHSDSERKFLMWLEGYTQEKDLSYIANQIITEPTRSLKIMFFKLNVHYEQETVLNIFIEIIGKINSDEKYYIVKNLVNLSELNEIVKEKFLILIYSSCDTERQYLLWLDSFTQEKNLSFIANQILIETISLNSNINPFEKIFDKITYPYEQEIVLNEFLELIGNIDSQEKYIRVKYLLDLYELDEKVKKSFLNSLYNQYDLERKYLLWLEGYTQEKDLSYIAKKITKKLIYNDQDKLRKIFEILKNSNEQENVIKEFIEIYGNIDSEVKYKILKTILDCSTLNEIVKENIQFKLHNEENIYYQIDQFLNYLQFIEGDKEQHILRILKKLDVIRFYSFCLDILKPLTEINNHYYYSGFTFLKIYLENKDYINETNIKYKNASIFKFNGKLLNETHFETKISFFKIIKSYIEDNINLIETNSKEIISTCNFELISKLIKTFQSFNSVNIQICSDLEIKEYHIQDYENQIVEICSTPELLKLWIYNLIEYFNFNNYCYYYFTLNLEERKMFNKKARSKMGEEIKKSMLKKREPWKFVKNEINSEMNYYTATWKSIWFGNGFVRICIDNEPNFSKQYKSDFSEEKFNFLYEYISGKRLKELKIIAKGEEIISIDGLEELEELIWKALIIKEVENFDGNIIRGVGLNRIPVNMLLRNQCIQLLNQFQLKEFEPTRVLEKTFNPIKEVKFGEISLGKTIDPIKGGIAVDVSILFSIPINEYEIAIIWESLELEKSKATHIFKCTRAEYEIIFSEIDFYLTNNLKVRSNLNSRDSEAIENQRKLRYLCRIDHDNFNFSKWENSLYEILPELKK